MSQFPKNVEEELSRLLARFNADTQQRVLEIGQVIAEEHARLKTLDPAVYGETAQLLAQAAAQIPVLARQYLQLNEAIKVAIDARRRDGVSKEKAPLS